MSEPETITLRRLPPEHRLREEVDLLKQRDVRNSFEIVHGLAGTAVEMAGGKYSACYCRAEDYPAEYDKPAIDPGEGWRLLEPDEGTAEGDEYFVGRDWLKSYKHLGDGVQNPVFKYRRRITLQPTIDPGEGWRLLEPDELVQEGDELLLDGQWKASSNWMDDSDRSQCEKHPYRRRITPQPDRLTELRHQGERQAAQIGRLDERIKELEEQLQSARNQLKQEVQFSLKKRAEMAAEIDEFKAKWNTAETQCVALEKVNNGLRKAISNKNDQILALQTQVRSAGEALRVEKQKHDEAVKQLNVSHTPFGSIARDISVHSQAAAWFRVTKTLDECIPDWNKEAAEISAMEAACASIRLLATQNKSLIEQSNKTHEANVELQRQVQQLADQNKPLRWERRRPTEEECLERWILIEDGAYPLGCTNTKDWEKMGAREICVLPPIAEPEPEPKMVTQRRWLCHNGSHSWVEVWPNDGDEPTDQWVERVRTDVTREVPE